MNRRLILVLALATLLASAGGATRSAIASGSVARNNPALWYRESDDWALYGDALLRLDSADETVRTTAAEYLLQLVRQLLSDGKENRCVDDFPYSPPPFRPKQARERLEGLAHLFGEVPRRVEALPIAKLLIEEGWQYPGDELDVENDGFRALVSIDDAAIEPVVASILSPPHADGTMVLAALDLVRNRNFRGLAPQVRLLANDYRNEVRSRAAMVALAIGAGELPSYEPARTLSLLDAELRELASMVFPIIPAKARWVRLTATERDTLWTICDFDSFDFDGAGPPPLSTSGWLLARTPTKLRIVNALGIEREIEPSKVSIANRELRDEIGSSESALIVPATVLPGVWAWLHGDKETAASLLLPFLYSPRDRRRLRWIFAQRLGREMQEQMLRVFSDDTELPSAARIARRLAGSEFEGYPYQPCAADLADALSRASSKDETATAKKWSDFARSEQLTIQDIPTLAAHLSEPGYIPVGRFSPVQMDDHGYPSRPAWPQRVDDVLARKINWLAKQDLVKLWEFRRLDAAGQLRRISEISAWAREHAPMSESDRDLATLEHNWSDRTARTSALDDLAKRKDIRVVPYLIKQAEEEPRRGFLQLQALYRLNDPRAVPVVRSWFSRLPSEAVQDGHRGDAYGDWQTRLYGGLILLRLGDRANLEGLDQIRKVLEVDKRGEYYPIVWDDLMSLNRPEATALLQGVVKDPLFCDEPDRCAATLCRLIASGNRDALDLLQSKLLPDKPDQVALERGYTPKADQMASAMSRRVGKIWFDFRQTADAKAAKRKEISDWFAAQFELIAAGKPAPFDCGSETGHRLADFPRFPDN